jgi:hypothetical protein
MTLRLCREVVRSQPQAKQCGQVEPGRGRAAFASGFPSAAPTKLASMAKPRPRGEAQAARRARPQGELACVGPALVRGRATGCRARPSPRPSSKAQAARRAGRGPTRMTSKTRSKARLAAGEEFGHGVQFRDRMTSKSDSRSCLAGRRQARMKRGIRPPRCAANPIPATAARELGEIGHVPILTAVIGRNEPAGGRSKRQQPPARAERARPGWAR